mmetsp:Transcript_31846/g.67852  ORF Transcript_31846/g.67852 Transcript_31846/m.67852 type:complete len:294 (-) Transcript_31846:2647-3528(-)
MTNGGLQQHSNDVSALHRPIPPAIASALPSIITRSGSLRPPIASPKLSTASACRPSRARDRRAPGKERAPLLLRSPPSDEGGSCGGTDASDERPGTVKNDEMHRFDSSGSNGSLPPVFPARRLSSAFGNVGRDRNFFPASLTTHPFFLLHNSIVAEISGGSKKPRCPPLPVKFCVEPAQHSTRDMPPAMPRALWCTSRTWPPTTLRDRGAGQIKSGGGGGDGKYGPRPRHPPRVFEGGRGLRPIKELRGEARRSIYLSLPLEHVHPSTQSCKRREILTVRCWWNQRNWRENTQ